jgi:hypothetical protein
MAGMERWKIVEQFTVYQIALLLEGRDPSDFEDYAFVEWDSRVRREISAVVTALRHAIAEESLVLHKPVYYGDGDIDFNLSLVHVDQLRKWLAKKGITGEFFIPPDFKARTIENPFGRYYAPKLAAANAAWEAVTSDPNRLRGRSPKKALTLWLTEHSFEYDLQNKDGTPNATGIEEIAKVANWRPAGGAPATPKVEEKPGVGFDETRALVQRNTGSGSPDRGFDDEIPF